MKPDKIVTSVIAIVLAMVMICQNAYASEAAYTENTTQEEFSESYLAEQMPSELMLGIFFTSNMDSSDTLYVSFDGLHFKKLATIFQDAHPTDNNDSYYIENQIPRVVGEPWYVGTLSEPSMQYDKTTGLFWSQSAWVDNSTTPGTYRPMLAYSSDLIHWSHPNSGNSTTAGANQFAGPLPYSREKVRNNQHYDCGHELFIDDDGTFYELATLGYYGYWYGEPQNDNMSLYISKINGVSPDQAVFSSPDSFEKDYLSVESYSPLYPLNDVDLQSTNIIDPFMFREGNTYYLCLKRDGIQNEIWKTTAPLDIASSRWTLVNGNVLTNYEGPSLTKMKGTYYIYTDKLGMISTGATGVGEYVQTSSDLITWSMPKAIVATDVNGNTITTRHGSVYTLTDPDAIKIVMNAYRAAGYTDDVSDVTPHKGSGEYSGDKTMYGQFDDVQDESKYYYTPVYWAYSKSITTGTSFSEFSPDAPCTRGQIVTFLWKAVGKPEPATLDTPFTDIVHGKYYEKAVAWAVEKGITSGTSPTTFEPDKPCSRGEIVTFLWRNAGKPAASSESSFADVPNGAFYKNAVSWAVGKGITNGATATTFDPYGSCTRAHAVTFIYRRYNN